ncbi:hypothetical protein [Hydrogenophaga sp. NH-16]|uniref:hypothetical protein n=1 Tax=Hydrogenophaga sp. NH-16 TaxID=2184519 RepID=UPI000FDC4078|nr:hypothetical protein [Hydrogenophaga sp. NH-16]
MTSWIDLPAPDEPVPAAYRGVWQRTLLETPEGRDTTTQVHWLQTEGWHADLRVPAGVDPATPQGRAQLQGFCGITRITPGVGGQTDICTWHRRWDVQPPRSTPDAGTMVFETPERVIETGVHGRYLEVWERLPGSTGPHAALAELDAQGLPTGAMRFVAGRYALTVRPRCAAWPTDLRPDETLAELVQRHPDAADALLDFELVFSEAPA